MTVDKERLRELCERATPGPWATEILGPADDDWPSAMAIAATVGRQKIYAKAGSNYPHADQQYIAAASPDVVLALIDENEQLRAERDAARKAVEIWEHIAERDHGSPMLTVARLKALALEACEIAIGHAEWNNDDKDVRRIAAIREEVSRG